MLSARYFAIRSQVLNSKWGKTSRIVNRFAFRSAPPSSRPQPPSTIFDDSPTRACATAAATRCLVVRRYPPNQYLLLGLVVPVDRDSQDQRSTVIPGQICLSALAHDGGDVRRSEGLDLADSVLDV